MQVDVAQPWQIDHPLRNDASISNHYDCVGLEGGKLGAEFIVVLDALRLRGRQLKCESRLLYRRRSKRKPTSARLVWLRDNQSNLKARMSQRFQRGNGKARRTTKDEGLTH